MSQTCVWFLGHLQRKTSANAIGDFKMCLLANLSSMRNIGHCNVLATTPPSRRPLENRFCRFVLFFDLFWCFSNRFVLFPRGILPQSLKILSFFYFISFCVFDVFCFFSRFCFVPLALAWSSCETCFIISLCLRCCLLATFLCDDWKPSVNMSPCCFTSVCLASRLIQIHPNQIWYESCRQRILVKSLLNKSWMTCAVFLGDVQFSSRKAWCSCPSRAELDFYERSVTYFQRHGITFGRGSWFFFGNQSLSFKHMVFLPKRWQLCFFEKSVTFQKKWCYFQK